MDIYQIIGGSSYRTVNGHYTSQSSITCVQSVGDVYSCVVNLCVWHINICVMLINHCEIVW